MHRLEEKHNTLGFYIKKTSKQFSQLHDIWHPYFELEIWIETDAADAVFGNLPRTPV